MEIFLLAYLYFFCKFFCPSISDGGQEKVICHNYVRLYTTQQETEGVREREKEREGEREYKSREREQR